METLYKIAKLIKTEKAFTVASHVGPDGDSLGATLALGHVLKMLGKEISLSFGEDSVSIPPQYKALEDLCWIKSYKKAKVNPVFIALECPQQLRLGGSYKLAKKARLIVNIDHHSDNKKYGTINYVNADISSTCEILYKIFKLLDIKLNKKIATFLYVGLVTDTGKFQYSNVSADTFEAAKELLRQGVNSNKIFQDIYENRRLKSLKLLGMVISRAHTEINGFIYSAITKDDFILSKVEIGETEDYIDFLRATSGIKVAAILKETNKDVKVSLRSQNRINVAKVAENFGGGGHSAAAGFTSRESLAKTINKLKEEISKCI